MSKKVAIIDAGAVGDVLALKDRVPSRGHNRRKAEVNRTEEWSDEWRIFGLTSADEAFDKPVIPEISELVDRFRGKLVSECPSPKSRRRTRVNDIDGDEFREDLYQAGRPECWESRKRVALEPQFIKLFVQVGGNASIDSTDLCWTGAAVCAAVDLLEDAGYRAEVFAALPAERADKDNEYDSLVICKLKEAEDALNIESMAMTVANAAFFRSYWFKVLYTLSPFDVAHGLGTAVPLSHFRNQIAGIAQNDQFFMVDQRYSEGGAESEVTRMMRAIGEAF